MKYLLAVLLVLLPAMSLVAQPQYVIGWTARVDNGNDDRAYGIAVDGNGNVYVTGYSYIGSDDDYITVKYDSLGNILWADTLDNGNDDNAIDIAVDGNGNVYVTGYSRIGSDDDYVTVKYDSSGNVLWVDTLDNGDTDEARCIALDEKGNIYVSGTSRIGSNNDALIVKYDSSGNILREDTLDNGSNDGAYGIAVDENGNVYIAGASEFGSVYDYITVKYDSLGNILWEDTISTQSMDFANGIAIDGIGNVYVTGYCYYHILTVKYDSSGNIIWADTLQNGNFDNALDIALDGNGIIYITGTTYNGSNNDYLTVKYDPSGNILWDSTLDNGSTDEAYGIALDEKGNIYVAGVTSNGSNYDYYTVKYEKYKDAEILSIISPDTVYADSDYVPEIFIKNESFEDAISFDVAAYIDSSGVYIYGDTESVSNLALGDSIALGFSACIAPSEQMELNLSFVILTPDGNPDNDTMSKIVHVIDINPPIVDSAVAFDGANPVAGIDDDDYVILYFSEPTNKVEFDNTNIDSILSLSDGHSWLDGFGSLGSCAWNPNGTQLLINLTTHISSPTIAVGDTITPDSATITDLYGNPCSSSAVLSGSFSPQGIKNKRISKKMMLNISTINGSSISFSCNVVREENYTITLYNIYGRVLWKTEMKESGYHTEKITGLPSGIYFLKLKQGKDIVNKKITVVK